ncbi:type I-E CRISPR-associated protein Cas6/Cse3/CasE, partial [Streptomyces sp. NPDC059447]|uniref:type I-E CRISPR-associated protein Cas6/Cse3/CasE n=1 Tax=Streptomyces sp. NPDC059447 TaxID=3346834 RepID=UPI0036BD72A9
WVRGQGARHGFMLRDAPVPQTLAPGIDPLSLVEEPAAVAPDVQIVRRDVVNFGKGTKDRNGETNGRGRVTICPVLFEGTMTVTDPAALRRALLEGIGSGKAYGAGLLTLARAEA